MMKAYYLSALLFVSCQTTKIPPPTPTSQPTSTTEAKLSPITIIPWLPELRLARISAPRTLDPNYVSDPEDERIAGALFAGLTECDPKTYEPKPGLASSWKSFDDNKRWQFTLRKDLFFSNQEPLTADDVISSWFRLIDPTLPSRVSFLLDPVVNARGFHNGERVRAKAEIKQTVNGSELSFAENEALVAVLADVNEVTQKVKLYTAPKGSTVTELYPGSIVEILEEVAPSALSAQSSQLLKVRVIGYAASLSSFTQEGFIEEVAIRPLYGPSLRAISKARISTFSFDTVDSPRVDEIGSGDVVAPIKGEFARSVGDKRMMRLRAASGEYLGWADASFIELKTFGAEKVLVQSIDGARLAWVDADKIEPDPSQVGIKKIDELTVELQLSQPSGYIPALLCRAQLAPTPQDTIKAEGYSWSEPEKLASSGPFMVGAMLPNGGISLKPNSLWYKKDLQFSKVSFSRFVKAQDKKDETPIYDLQRESADVAIEKYRAGELDALFLTTWSFDTTKLASNQYADLFTRPDYQSIGAWQTYQIRLNTSRDSLKDPKVRQAINAAINREELRMLTSSSPSLFRSLRAKTSFSPVFAQYPLPSTPNISTSEAEKLWKEVSPSKRPKKLSLLVPDWILSRSIAENIKTQLKTTLGVELLIEYQPWVEVSGRSKRGEFDLVLISWLGDFTDPATFVGMLASYSPENTTGWKSDVFEEAILAAEKETNHQKRLQRLSEAEGILLQEAPLIPLFSESEYTWLNPKLQGFVANPMLLIDWSALSLLQ